MLISAEWILLPEDWKSATKIREDKQYWTILFPERYASFSSGIGAENNEWQLFPWKSVKNILLRMVSQLLKVAGRNTWKI